MDIGKFIGRHLIDVHVIFCYVQRRSNLIVAAPILPRAFSETGVARQAYQPIVLAAARGGDHGSQIEFHDRTGSTAYIIRYVVPPKVAAANSVVPFDFYHAPPA